MTTPKIRPVDSSDWEPIASIFNLFVEESSAAYLDRPVKDSFFRNRHVANLAYPFVVCEIEGETVGFAYLAPFHPASTMRRSATVTYFIHPAHTGKGIGTAFLLHLLEAGAAIGVANFIAHVSSLNPGSIRFHLRHGFTECGRFLDVGVKNGRPFDMVWLQLRQAVRRPAGRPVEAGGDP
jgi:phosphinothricin acetyltransferase